MTQQNTKTRRYGRILLRTFLWVAGIFLLYIIVAITYGTLTDWQPPAEQAAEEYATTPTATIADSVLSFAIWNIGYTGLGVESNFFYDTPSGFYYAGGRMIRPPHELSQKNLEGAEQFVSSTKADFFLLQEVDYASRRSYYANTFDSLRDQQSTYAAYYAPNYKNARVPIPLLQPWAAYGAVNSGVATFSRFQPQVSTRIQLPGQFGWPERVFSLDRCILLQRYTLANGHQLVLMNIHLSAYDADGSLKKEQMIFLRDIAMAEYEQGNYVIIGGDWNQCPPNFAFDTFAPGKTQGHQQYNIAPDYYPADWQWIYDPTQPTNRKMRDVYAAGETFITLIDFYLTSPNLQTLQVKTIDQGFRYSDHQPVWMEVKLR